MEEEKIITETRKKANPGPLGLLGFGMTTLLLNLHNAGVFGLNIMIAAMGFALGGAAQIIAGVLEFKHDNTFGGTAFCAYGFFWWSLVLVWWNPFHMEPASGSAMGFYLLVWCLFTAFMFIGTLSHNTITKLVFGSLTVLFLLLAIGNFTEAEGVHISAGIVGIICGAFAIYSAMAQIVNAELGKKIFPL